MNFKYEIGDEVLDSISGFKGVITARTEYLYGTINYHVKPMELKDNKPQEEESIEEPQVQLLTKNKLKVEGDFEPRFNLGDVVRDSLTSYKGTVVARVYYINGCIHVGVKSSELKDGAPLPSVWFNQDQVELLEETKQTERKSNGGPEEKPRIII